MSHPLDNMVWNALASSQAHLGEASSNGAAVRYFPDVSPFCAVRDDDPGAWSGLAELAGPSQVVVLFMREPPQTPPGWQSLMTEVLTQYVADQLKPAPEQVFEELQDASVAAAMELVAATEPGPFERRTIETGRYLCLHRDGKLVAMAGERFRVPDWIEVSAVCVDPSAQRQGLGGALTLAVAHGIRESGNEAMLHVRDGNTAAHALYPNLGFRFRRDLYTCVLRTPAAE